MTLTLEGLASLKAAHYRCLHSSQERAARSQIVVRGLRTKVDKAAPVRRYFVDPTTLRHKPDED